MLLSFCTSAENNKYINEIRTGKKDSPNTGWVNGIHVSGKDTIILYTWNIQRFVKEVRKRQKEFNLNWLNRATDEELIMNITIETLIHELFHFNQFHMQEVKINDGLSNRYEAEAETETAIFIVTHLNELYDRLQYIPTGFWNLVHSYNTLVYNIYGRIGNIFDQRIFYWVYATKYGNNYKRLSRMGTRSLLYTLLEGYHLVDEDGKIPKELCDTIEGADTILLAPKTQVTHDILLYNEDEVAIFKVAGIWKPIAPIIDTLHYCLSLGINVDAEDEPTKVKELLYNEMDTQLPFNFNCLLSVETEENDKVVILRYFFPEEMEKRFHKAIYEE